MKAANADKQQGHNRWLRSAGDARKECGLAVQESTLRVPNPERVIWPLKDPTLAPPAQRAAAKLHAKVCNYADHVRPYRDSCFSLWTEQLDTHRFEDGEEIDVCLSELSSWMSRLYEEEKIVHDELTGNTTETEIKRVYLAPKYGRMMYEQLDACMEEIGFAAHLQPGRDRDDEGW